MTQLKHSIGMADDGLGVVQEWLEQLHHLADHAHRPEASGELAQVTVMLGEARAKLERAVDSLSGPEGPPVRIERV